MLLHRSSLGDESLDVQRKIFVKDFELPHLTKFVADILEELEGDEIGVLPLRSFRDGLHFIQPDAVDPAAKILGEGLHPVDGGGG